MKETKKRKRRFKVLIILSSIVFVIGLVGISVVISDAPARAELKNIIIADVDFGNLNDGVYTGEYRGTKNSFRDVAVEVTVESGAVTKITVIMLFFSFITAMFVTASFSAQLSGNPYCVDAISLSYALFGGDTADSRKIAQVIVLTVFLFIGYRLYVNGFGRKERIGALSFLAAAVLASNITGYTSEHVQHRKDACRGYPADGCTD